MQECALSMYSGTLALVKHSGFTCVCLRRVDFLTPYMFSHAIRIKCNPLRQGITNLLAVLEWQFSFGHVLN